MAVFAQILNDRAAISTEWTDESLDTGMDKLVSHKLSTHCELLRTQIAGKRLLAVTAHVTA